MQLKDRKDKSAQKTVLHPTQRVSAKLTGSPRALYETTESPWLSESLLLIHIKEGRQQLQKSPVYYVNVDS